MRYNFAINVHHLDNSPVLDEKGEPLRLNKFLANELMYDRSPADVFKKFEWAQKLYHDGAIDLDRQDQKKFEDFITSIPNLSIVVRAAALLIITEKPKE